MKTKSSKTNGKARRWGVYCGASLAIDPKALPRYTYQTREAAEKSLPKMDRECASKAKHFVRMIKPVKPSGAVMIPTI